MGPGGSEGPLMDAHDIARKAGIPSRFRMRSDEYEPGSFRRYRAVSTRAVMEEPTGGGASIFVETRPFLVRKTALYF